MAQQVKMKRSAVAGNIPSTAQLDLGELAVNTYDGKLYLKKDNGTESIVEIGGGSYLPLTGGTLTGDLSFGSQAGTWISSNAMADSIGWNPTYGTYIGSNVSGNNDYIYGNGTIRKNNTFSTLWHSGNDGSGSGLDADLLDGNQASAFALAGHSHSYLPLTGGTLDNGTSTTLSIKCDDGGQAMLRANGDNQGTGIVEVGQSNTYGGGISYNGDGSPAFVNGETADNITFYRLDNGTRTEVFHYPYNSNTVNFNSTPTVGGSNAVFHDGYHPNADKLTTARTINGVSFDGSANITVADSTKLPLTGGTLTGPLILDNAGGVNALQLNGVSPTIALNDTDGDSFYFHVNSNNFYILADRDGSGGYAGWETPHPLYLEADTNIGYLFGSRMFADDYHPNADKWTTSRTLTLNGDASGSVSWDGSGDATLTVAVGDDSHNHSSSTGDFNAGGDLYAGGGQVFVNSGNADVKFGLWGNDITTYGIGMTSGVTYGDLNDYAMTFCMNNDTDRGFWWGYSGQSKSDGAMSLSTAGNLTTKGFIKANDHILASSTDTGSQLWAHRSVGTTNQETGSIKFQAGLATSPTAVMTYSEIAGYTVNTTLGTNTGGILFKTWNNTTATERMRLDSAGKLGIGRSPAEMLDVNGNAQATRFISTQATGTAPFSVSSTTVVSNLNADMLDGQHGSYYQPASSAITTANIASQNVANADTADKLTTARSIALSGDVTGSANFDGSANISITATVTDDSHNHVISNVDGLQAALDAKPDNFNDLPNTVVSTTTTMFTGGSATAPVATGANNTGFGADAGKTISNGTNNTAFGYSSLGSEVSGSHNTAIGNLACATQTGRTGNTAVGSLASYYGGTNSAGAVYVGYLAGYGSTSTVSANYNIGIGQSAGYAITTGDYNVSVGFTAGYNASSDLVNTAIGYRAGYQNKGSYCTHVGGQSGYLSTGTGNTGCGYTSGYDMDGSYNVAIGFSAGTINSTGSYNILIGADCEMDSPTDSNTCYIGAVATDTETITRFAVRGCNFDMNTTALYYGAEIRAGGDVIAFYASDINLKENIKEIPNALEKLNQIRGVTYDWKDEYLESKGGVDDYFNRKHDVGVIAQEVEAILPEVVAERKDGTKAVRYEKLTALLIESVKELKAEVDTLKAELKELKDGNH